MKAYLTVGISASGKSTLAEKLAKYSGYTEINRDWIRFNLVSPGANWSNYKFNGSNEKKVTEIQGQMIMEAYGKGENIVISDTNLNPKVRNSLIQKLEDLGYEVSIYDFPVTREQAVKRDNLRANGVGSYTYQCVTRDTFGFAVKATYTEVNGKKIPIFKDPKTDSKKKSAKGLLFVGKDENGDYVLTDNVTREKEESEENELKIRFLNGSFFNQTTLDKIRELL